MLNNGPTLSLKLHHETEMGLQINQKDKKFGRTETIEDESREENMIAVSWMNDFGNNQKEFEVNNRG